MMRLNTYLCRRVLRYTVRCSVVLPLILVVLLLFSGCTSRREVNVSEEKGPALSLLLSSVNIPYNKESTVSSVRLIVAHSVTGEVLYNELLTWDGENAPVGGKDSDLIKWKHNPGRYDLYLIANEKSLSEEGRNRLTRGLYNIMGLKEPINQGFSIGEVATLDDTKRPLLSTSVLKGYRINANGTIDNPERIEATLVQNLSKISIEVYRKEGSDSTKNHAVIDKMQLVRINTTYPLLFDPNASADTSGVITSDEFATDLDPDLYNPTNFSHPIYTCKDHYLSERLCNKGEEGNATALRVWYRPYKDAPTTEQLMQEFPLDVQNLASYREDVLSHLGHANTILNDLSLKSVMRGVEYKIKIVITDEKIKPEMNLTVAQWELAEQNVSYEDNVLTATKEVVMLNYPEGSANSLKILSNIEDHRQLRWNVIEGDISWLNISPTGSEMVELDGEDKEYTFRALSENSGNAERSVVIEFNAQGYQYPVKVTVTQRPRQVMEMRRYVCFTNAGGYADIEINNFGYGWNTAIVSNVSTMSHESNWLILEKSADNNTLRITTNGTGDKDLLRYAIVKVSDGSAHAAYIRVEQGNYQDFTVTYSDNTTDVWLDRNLGALQSAFNREAWFTGGEIANIERVMRNGYYYQYGRVPDGYHTKGMILQRGLLRASLDPASELSYERLDLELRPAGFPLRWSDQVSAEVSGKPCKDEQYGKFIAGYDESWFIPVEGVISPAWTNADGSKRAGVDPCPEGYRVPTYDEMTRLLSVAGHLWKAEAAGIWIPAKDVNEEPKDLYLPLSGYREGNGVLDLGRWMNPDTNVTWYATSTLTAEGKVKVKRISRYALNGEDTVSLSAGLVVRCIKEK